MTQLSRNSNGYLDIIWIHNFGTAIVSWTPARNAFSSRIMDKCHNCLEYCSAVQCEKCGALQSNLLNECLGEDKWFAFNTGVRDIPGYMITREIYMIKVGGSGEGKSVRQMFCGGCGAWINMDLERCPCCRIATVQASPGITGTSPAHGYNSNHPWFRCTDDNPRNHGLNPSIHYTNFVTARLQVTGHHRVDGVEGPVRTVGDAGPTGPTGPIGNVGPAGNAGLEQDVEDPYYDDDYDEDDDDYDEDDED
jgi:hypothetical protein